MDHKYGDMISDILTGFEKFKVKINQDPAQFANLARHQEPHLMIIACSDSRVCPTSVLNLDPGYAFVVRNIANMVPPCDMSKNVGVGAALQYAVEELKVDCILVMGHSKCGGIKGLLEMSEGESANLNFVQEWVKIGLEAKRNVEENDIDPNQKSAECEKAAVNISLDNLLTYPFVSNAVGERKLILVGGYYDFSQTTVANAPKVDFGYWKHPSC